MFQTKVAQKIKTHVLGSINVFRNRAVYEIMWINVVQRIQNLMAHDDTREGK